MMAAVVGNDVHKLEVWGSLADASNSMLRQGQGYGAELKLSHAVQKLPITWKWKLHVDGGTSVNNHSQRQRSHIQPSS